MTIAQATHYRRLERVLFYIADHWSEQPSLETLADIAALSPDHFQRVFADWVGLSPKQFLAAISHREISTRLRNGESLLDAALAAGYSGPSRLHDLFIKIEAMTPGAYKAKAEGIDIAYAFHPTPFGDALFAATTHGLCHLAFGDEGTSLHIDDLYKRWPRARFYEDAKETAPYAAAIFDNNRPVQGPLRLYLKGTKFQHQVWRALMSLPAGTITSYGRIARGLGSSPRAVGGAVGANPLAWLIPCHRVLAENDRLQGYRWGLPRKVAMLGFEAAGQGIQLSTAA